MRTKISRLSAQLAKEDLSFATLGAIIRKNEPEIWETFNAQSTSFDGWSLASKQDVLRSWLQGELTCDHDNRQTLDAEGMKSIHLWMLGVCKEAANSSEVEASAEASPAQDAHSAENFLASNAVPVLPTLADMLKGSTANALTQGQIPG